MWEVEHRRLINGTGESRGELSESEKEADFYLKFSPV